MNDIEQSEFLKKYIEDKRLDAAYLTKRAENEPPINSQDIRTYEDFEHILDHTFKRIIKFTDDAGQTWRYGKVSHRTMINNEFMPYIYNGELRPNYSTHSSIPIEEKDFVDNTRRLIIRPVIEEEALSLRFSYE